MQIVNNVIFVSSNIEDKKFCNGMEKLNISVTDIEAMTTTKKTFSATGRGSRKTKCGQ